MTQLTITEAIEQGEDAMQACTAKAQALGFSADAARAFVLGYLQAYGPSYSEDVVDAAIKTGRAELVAHEARAWGSIFATLSRRNRIRCLRADGIRRHGHGTTGARQWTIVQ